MTSAIPVKELYMRNTRLFLASAVVLALLSSPVWAKGFDKALTFLNPNSLTTATDDPESGDYAYYYDADSENVVKRDASNIADLLGVTSSAAELNILDGYTGTTAELNYVDLTTLGTGAASKAVVLDASGDYTFPATATIVMPASGSFTFDASSVLTVNTTATLSGDVVGDGGDQLFGFLQDQVASTTVSATIAQCGKTFVNDSADVITLPEASTALGCRYTFVCGNASNFDINPADGTDQIGLVFSITGANTTTAITPSAGDAIRCAAVGASIVLEAVGANLWVSVANANGTWTDVN
jgi:hypothetical protein